MARRIVLTVLFFAVSVMPTVSHADIFKIEGPATCPGNIGSGLCNGSVPFSFTDFRNGTITFNIDVPLLGGTEEWVLINDTGSTLTNFSFVFSGSQANNASCQIANSHGATLVNPSSQCSIVDSLGHTTSLGKTQIGGGGQYFTPDATITFSGLNIANGASFNLDFVSMQGTGTVTSVPEPNSLVLLSTSIAGLAGAAWKKLRK
jgi:hypothetical protein